MKSYRPGIRAVAVLACALTGPAVRAQAPDRSALPSTIPVFPLQDTTLFPHATRPLLIFEPRYRAMVADAIKGDGIIGMVRLQPGHEAEYEGRPPIDAVGCAGRIVEHELLPDGRYTIVLSGTTRFRVLSEDQGRPYRLARVQPLGEEAALGEGATALRAARRRIEELLAAAGIELDQATSSDEEVVDTVAQYVDMPSGRRQELLEMPGPLRRARRLVELLSAR